MKTFTLLLLIFLGSALALVNNVNPVSYWTFQLSGVAVGVYASWRVFRAVLGYVAAR